MVDRGNGIVGPNGQAGPDQFGAECTTESLEEADGAGEGAGRRRVRVITKQRGRAGCLTDGKLSASQKTAMITPNTSCPKRRVLQCEYMLGLEHG